MPRPLAITIISILAILFGALSLPVKLLVLFSPEIYEDVSDFMTVTGGSQILPIPMPLQLAHGLIGSLVWITAGVALWKGLNWGRWLAIFWGGTVLLITLLLLGLGARLLPKTVAFAVMCYFLTNRKAAGYFGARR